MARHPHIPGLEISSGGYITAVDGKSLGGAIEHKRRAGFSQRHGDILVGCATRYLKPFRHGDEFIALMPGACSEAILSGKSIRLLLDHDEGKLVTSSRTGLLHVRPESDGLSVVASLPDTPLGREAAELAATGSAGMSINGQWVRHEIKRIADTDVRLVYEIALEEISICRRGAVPGTWCSLTDMSGAKSLLRGRGLAAEGAAVRVRQTLEDLSRRLAEAI
jgi:HK97 family phage prohead protease